MTHKFTVLLLRPDYLADEFGKDTCTSFVCIDEDDPDQAFLAAQQEALSRDLDEAQALHTDPDDYYPLFVCRGHIDNLA